MEYKFIIDSKKYFSKVDFEIEVMIITAILGVVLTIIGLYFVIRKYLKDRKVKNEKNK